MGKGRRIKSALRRFLWVAVSIVLWLSLLIAVCVAFYLTWNFSASADELLPTLGAQPRSPQFYIYNFSDRTNRTGERETVTSEVWSEKQTVYVPYE